VRVRKEEPPVGTDGGENRGGVRLGHCREREGD